MNKHVQQIIDHVWGPTGSVILHILLIFLLINFLVFEVREHVADVEVKLMEIETVELEDLERVLEEIEDVEDVMDQIQPPEVALDEAPPDPSQMDQADEDVDFSNLDVMQEFSGPLVLKGLFAGRDAGGRARMLKEFSSGMGKYTEPAVIRALEWLKRNQRDDGAWPAGHVNIDRAPHVGVATTALGLLAFLAHGETTTSVMYGRTVEKAIRYLLTQQESDRNPAGAFCALNQPGVYAHAMAAYAISEAYALTRIPKLKGAMDRAIGHIVNGQQARGGWNYSYQKGDRRDTSVSSWQVQALKAAYMAGTEVPGVQEAMQLAAKDLKHVYNENNGRFQYSMSPTDPRPTQGGQPNATAMAVLCLQLIGHGKSNEALGGIASHENASCQWEDNNNVFAMYIWYYLTQAKFHNGGSTWQNWNREFARAYVKNQKEDGRWEGPFFPPEDMSTHHYENNYGPAFTTALGALTLQVYYRFLPTYQEIAVEDQQISPASEDDIEIDII
jgi:hypothetical protein